MTLVERLQATGIRRLGSPSRGFRYRSAGGAAITKGDRVRIAALRIPPAWRDVAISASPGSAVQAVGRDAAKRWQYLYHARHVAQRGRKKFQRVVHFLAALPRMRRAIARDLALPGLPREKVLACILRILSTCFLRPGSQVYADENRSYGIATLTRRHVTVRGDTVQFDFPGKSGQRQERALQDRRVAKIVRDLLRVPGKGGEVFKYLDADGRVVDVRRRHINEYIKDVMGERFSAKDFRTWAGTLICASALARAGVVPGESQAARKRTIVAAIRETATHLGNTPAVCRASYIEPLVLARFERGRVLRAYAKSVEELMRYRGLGHHRAERALLAMLESRGD